MSDDDLENRLDLAAHTYRYLDQPSAPTVSADRAAPGARPSAVVNALRFPGFLADLYSSQARGLLHTLATPHDVTTSGVDLDREIGFGVNAALSGLAGVPLAPPGALAAGGARPRMAPVSSPIEPQPLLPSGRTLDFTQDRSGLWSHAEGPFNVGQAQGLPTEPARAADRGLGLVGEGPRGGSASLEEAQRSAEGWAGTSPPLRGLPQQALTLQGEPYIPGPSEAIHIAAHYYMRNAGVQKYEFPEVYSPVDVPRAQRIAQAFEEMPHAPNDPKVKAAYKAMIDETLAQYQEIKKTGLKIDFIKPDQPNPYYESPRLANKDVRDNNHLWVFPTDSGFGSGGKVDYAKNHPLLTPTNEKIGDRTLVANDVFRIVHDYFGHFKDGNGFRAAGEENAWRSHAAMYSPIARQAMTTETRGQNSWLNHGPYGDKNRTAKTENTVFADQKVGILPKWAIEEGRKDPVSAPAIREQSAPLFDYSRLHEVPDLPQRDLPRYEPPRGVPDDIVKAMSPAAIRRVNKIVAGGAKQGGLEWYNLMPLRQEFVSELGATEGPARFNRLMRYVEASSPLETPVTNARIASYFNWLEAHGMPMPATTRAGTGNAKLVRSNPPLYGSMAQALHADNAARILAGESRPALLKPESFGENLQGNYSPVTIDRHNMTLWGLKGETPGKTGYSYMERVQQEQARKMGMAPAQYQASGWMPYGSSTDPMLKVFEDAITRTADRLGRTKKRVLKDVIRGKQTLYSVGGVPIHYNALDDRDQ